MIKHKNYIDINRFQLKYSECFKVGDDIVIQEKIDGANSSFEFDDESNSIKCFSRKNELSFNNTLRGFWNWGQKLNLDYHCCKNERIFGEWLVSHTVPYPQDKYSEFYCFDIYDTEKCEWKNQDNVKAYCDVSGIKYVPTFYKGKFISWEHCMSFVGETEMGGAYGEGIVIKNMTRLNDPNNYLPFVIKIVGEKFNEKAERKTRYVDPKQIAIKELALEIASTIITKPRVVKLLHKMIDDDIIPVDWDSKDMGIIAKNISTLVYNDCIKEENEVVEEVGETFGKLCNSISMCIIKDLLKEQ